MTGTVDVRHPTAGRTSAVYEVTQSIRNKYLHIQKQLLPIPRITAHDAARSLLRRRQISIDIYAGTQAAANQLHGAAAIDRRDRLTDRRAPHRYIDAHRSHRSKRTPEIAVLHHFTNNTQCAKNPGLIRSATTFLTFCSRNVLQHGTKHKSSYEKCKTTHSLVLLYRSRKSRKQTNSCNEKIV